MSTHAEPVCRFLHPQAETTKHRGIAVVWDADHDERILEFIDHLPRHLQAKLIAVGETKGTINLLWQETVPPGYSSGQMVNAPRDMWYILESEAVEALPVKQPAQWEHPRAKLKSEATILFAELRVTLGDQGARNEVCRRLSAKYSVATLRRYLRESKNGRAK